MKMGEAKMEPRRLKDNGLRGAAFIRWAQYLLLKSEGLGATTVCRRLGDGRVRVLLFGRGPLGLPFFRKRVGRAGEPGLEEDVYRVCADRGGVWVGFRE